MHNIISIIFSIICLLLSTASNASIIGEESIVNLTHSDGLIGETVHRVITDSMGLKWIATNSGVSVFNGKQLRSIPIYDNDGQIVEVYDLCNMSDKSIWAATNKGVWRMCYGNDMFEHVLPEVKHAISLLSVGDTLFIGSEQGMQFYDGSKIFHLDVSVSKHGLDNIVRQYQRDEKGQIWFLGRYDLYRFDPMAHKIDQFKLNIPESKPILTQFVSIGNNKFIVGTRGIGLYLCNISEQISQRIDGIGNIVSTVNKCADGNICVATDGSGAYLLSVDGDKVSIKESFCASGDENHRLPSNGIYSYYRDDNGVNWFGFVRYGLAYTYYFRNIFEPFKTKTFTSEGLNIRTYCRHSDDIVIGLQDGFIHVDTQTGVHQFFSLENIGNGHIVNSLCWWNGCFYIGTFDGGLSVFNPRTKKIQRQSFSSLLNNESIGDMKVSADGKLWIGCSNGLMIIDNDNNIQHYTEQNSHIVGGLILSITFDSSNNAWLTGANGCSLYSAISQSIVNTKFPDRFFNTQPWMRGTLGHDGLIFMRSGPQTFYTNEQMTDWGELKLPIKFYDKWCRGFIDDMNGHYILASERGLFCFDYDMQLMMSYGYSDGLKGNFINDIFIDHSNRLWVSTSQGLFFSDLAMHQKSSRQSNNTILLTNIWLGDKNMTNGQEYVINREKSIYLSWNLTSERLQAQTLLLDYSKHAGRIYQYRIDNNEWIAVDDGQYFSIDNLQLGSHKIAIRQVGLLDSTTTYSIYVVPSVGAIVELILLILTFILILFLFRYSKFTNRVIIEHQFTEQALIEESRELRECTDYISDSGEISLKYKKVKLNETECVEIVKRLKEYIEHEKVYTNADLKMKDLANVLHISASKLSQIFNLYINENYYEFINKYRLDEFKRLIANGEYKHFTIIALSEQCGFKKSNFFSTFRKVEGLTPSEYLKKQGIKI